MTYELKHADDPKKIEEQRYATGDTIQFTTFTSCMGVMALTADNKIKGIHLVMVGDKGAFDETVAKAVVDQLAGCKSGSAVLVGHLPSWEKQFPTAYKAMENALKGKLGAITEVVKEDGTYGGRIQGGKIQVTG